MNTEDKLEQGQPKIPSGLKVGVSPSVTTDSMITPVQTPLTLLKAQQQQHRRQNYGQHSTKQKMSNIMKIYKCISCEFQSKKLEDIQYVHYLILY